MTLEECLRLAKNARFDGLELNYDLESDLSPKAGTKEFEAIRKMADRMLPQAEKLGVRLNIENIFFNGYLMTPMEMNAFVDSYQSTHVRVHFDTGNILALYAATPEVRLLQESRAGRLPQSVST